MKIILCLCINLFSALRFVHVQDKTLVEEIYYFKTHIMPHDIKGSLQPCMVSKLYIL